MLQNQYSQKISRDQIGIKRKDCISIRYGQRLGATIGDKNTNETEFQVEQDSTGDLQYDYQKLTSEQKRHIADQHEHPYECENSPWRRQLSAGTGQGNSTYTNRY